MTSGSTDGALYRLRRHAPSQQDDHELFKFQDGAQIKLAHLAYLG